MGGKGRLASMGGVSGVSADGTRAARLVALASGAVVVLTAVLALLALALGHRVAPVIVASISLASYLLFMTFALSRLSFFDDLRRLGWRVLAGVALGAAALSCAMALYVAQSKQILFWDSGMYWYGALGLIEQLDGGGVRATLEAVVDSVNTSDYNQVASLVISLPMMVTRSYPAFVGWCAALFLCPALAVGAWLTMRVALGGVFDGGALALALACSALFAPFYVPVLLGFVDAIALLAGVVFLGYALTADFSRPRPLAALCYGVLGLLTFLLRRYFAYFTVSACVVLLCRLAWLLVRARPEARGRVAHAYLVNALAAVLAVSLPLATAFRGFFVRSFFNNYSATYAAYVEYGSLSERVVAYSLGVGPWYLALGAAGVLEAVRLRSWGVLRRQLVLALSVCLTLALFWRTQDFTIQHYYVIDAQLCLLSGCGALLFVRRAGARAKGGVQGRLLAAAFVALSGVVTLNMIGLLPGGARLRPVLGNVAYATTVRGDLGEIARIDSDVEGVLSETGGSLYVVASSSVMNDAIIMRSYAPERLYPPFPLASASHIDLRDGFATSFLDAPLVLVCDPVQTHASDPQTQFVTLELTRLMLARDSYLGSHYVEVEEYDLERGVVARLYRKTSELSEGDIRQLEATFDERYPGYPELFHDRFEAYLSARRAG